MSAYHCDRCIRVLTNGHCTNRKCPAYRVRAASPVPVGTPQPIRYWCRACPEVFYDAETSNAHHDATGHHQTHRPPIGTPVPTLCGCGHIRISHDDNSWCLVRGCECVYFIAAVPPCDLCAGDEMRPCPRCRPTHTDLMVPPESIPDYVPPAAPTSETADTPHRSAYAFPIYACEKCWHGESRLSMANNVILACPKCGGTMREVGIPVTEAPAPCNLLCVVCARVKPWGIFDSISGVAVCVECRDKARAPLPPTSETADTPHAREITEWLADIAHALDVLPDHDSPDHNDAIRSLANLRALLLSCATCKDDERTYAPFPCPACRPSVAASPAPAATRWYCEDCDAFTNATVENGEIVCAYKHIIASFTGPAPADTTPAESPAPMCTCGHDALAHISIGYVTEDCRKCDCGNFVDASAAPSQPSEPTADREALDTIRAAMSHYRRAPGLGAGRLSLYDLLTTIEAALAASRPTT